MLSSQILFLVPLLFAASIPTYFLNFNFFNHSSLFAFYTCYSTAQFKLDYTRVHHYTSRHVSQVDRDSDCVCTRKKYITYCTTAGDARVHARYVQFVGVFRLNCTRALDTNAILCTPKDRHTRAFSLARHVEGHPSCRLYLPYRICCTQ